jgi:hypothetical protein
VVIHSDILSFMHYFSYKIGLFFAFFIQSVLRHFKNLKDIGILDLVMIGQY